MKKILLLIMTLLLLGCSTQKEYIYIKPTPHQFKKTQQPKVRTVRVYKKDEKIYRLYIKQFRDIIKFHNTQIDDYYNSFKGK